MATLTGPKTNSADTKKAKENERAVTKSQTPSSHPGPWTPNGMRRLWKDRYETCPQKRVKVVSDEDIVSHLTSSLAVGDVTIQESLRLLHYWVEMVLFQAYQEIASEAVSSPVFIEVLAVSLNDVFMPGTEQADSLANQANLPHDKAAMFLDRFRLWTGTQKQGVPLKSLGWIHKETGRPGLVLCWDEAIPQARCRKHWQQSIGAEILQKRDQEFLLRLDASSGKPSSNVLYTVEGRELDNLNDLEEGDRVRYWENFEGHPLIIAEVYLSPYAKQRMAEWSGIDDRVYNSVPVG